MADEQTNKPIPREGDELFEAMRALRKRRKKVNKAKRAAEEVQYLNIVAMMDMMTILMVFLLKSVSFSTVSVSGTEGMTLPTSSTKDEPVEAVKVFITNSEIDVDDKKVAEIQRGAVVQQYVSPDNEYLIPNLKMALDEKAVERASMRKYDPNTDPENNLTVMADKDTPYAIIVQVLYTAGQVSQGSLGSEVSFGAFRLTVLKRDQMD